MGAELDYLRELNILSVTFRLALAMISGGMIGLERGRKRRPAGFRTHILICLGAAMTTLTSQYLYLNMHYYTDMARLGAQVVAGIGFIGAGTIIVTRQQRVKGLTTAAGLWASACMGLAVGAGFYECIALAFVLIFLCIRIFPIIDNFIRENAKIMNIYVEFESLDNMGTIINRIKTQNVQIFDVDIERGREKRSRNPSAVFSVHLNQRKTHTQILSALSDMDCIYTIEEI